MERKKSARHGPLALASEKAPGEFGARAINPSAVNLNTDGSDLSRTVRCVTGEECEYFSAAV